MRIEPIIYNNRNNALELSLQSDGTAIVHNTLTRCQLIVGATTLDSNTTPALFDLTQADRLVLKLGSAGLTAGKHLARLVVFDALNTSGLVWGEFVLTVSD